MSTIRQMPAVSRCIGRIDRLVSTPVPFLPSDWTFLRVWLILINNALALVVCLVRLLSLVSLSIVSDHSAADQHFERLRHSQAVRRPLRTHRDGRPAHALPFRRSQ